MGIERKLEEKSKETDNYIQKVSIINKGLFRKGLLHSRFSLLFQYETQGEGDVASTFTKALFCVLLLLKY